MVYILYRSEKIEGYYNTNILVGVFSTVTNADEGKNKMITAHRMDNWRDMVIHFTKHDMCEMSDEYKMATATFDYHLHDRPKFDQSQKSDKKYVKEHTERIQAWHGKKSKLGQNIHAVVLDIIAAAERYADAYCIGDVPETYNDRSIDEWKEIPKYWIDTHGLDTLNWKA